MPESQGLSLILLVEDDEGIRAPLKMLLEMEGYEVVVAENGKDALRMLSGILRPCLVLLDLSMPIMDGSKFLEILRTSRLHHMIATIPVIIQTAEENPAAEAVNRAHGLIKKPVSLEKLLEVVRKYCRKRESVAQAA